MHVPLLVPARVTFEKLLLEAVCVGVADALAPIMAKPIVLPDAPTLVELGFAKERVASWFALAGPAGMPPALVGKIRDIFIQASKDAELQKRLSENGTPIVSSTPEEMGRAMQQEWDTMQVLAKTLNLRQP